MVFVVRIDYRFVYFYVSCGFPHLGVQLHAMDRTIITFARTPTLEHEVTAVVDSGLYSDAESFVSDAVHTLLAARPELRTAAACNLYRRGIFSLSKAAEWSGLTIEGLKEALDRTSIERTAPESLDEIESMAHFALSVANRPSL